MHCDDPPAQKSDAMEQLETIWERKRAVCENRVMVVCYGDHKNLYNTVIVDRGPIPSDSLFLNSKWAGTIFYCFIDVNYTVWAKEELITIYKRHTGGPGLWEVPAEIVQNEPRMCKPRFEGRNYAPPSTQIYLDNRSMVKKLSAYWNAKRPTTTDNLLVFVGNTETYRSAEYSSSTVIDWDFFNDVAEEAKDDFSIMYTLSLVEEYEQNHSMLYKQWQTERVNGSAQRMLNNTGQVLMVTPFGAKTLEHEQYEWKDRNMKMVEALAEYWDNVRTSAVDKLCVDIGSDKKKKWAWYKGTEPLDIDAWEGIAQDAGKEFGIIFGLVSEVVSLGHYSSFLFKERDRVAPLKGVWKMDNSTMKAGYFELPSKKKKTINPEVSAFIHDFHRYWEKLRVNLTPCVLWAYYGKKDKNGNIAVDQDQQIPVKEMKENMVGVEGDITIAFSIAKWGEGTEALSRAEGWFRTCNELPGCNAWNVHWRTGSIIQTNLFKAVAQELTPTGVLNEKIINKLQQEWCRRKNKTTHHIVAIMGDKEHPCIVSQNSWGANVFDSIPNYVKNTDNGFSILFTQVPRRNLVEAIKKMGLQWKTFWEDGKIREINVVTEPEVQIHPVDAGGSIEKESPSPAELTQRHNEKVVEYVKERWENWLGYDKARNLYCIVGNGRKYKAFVFTPLDMMNPDVLFSIVRDWKEKVEVTCGINPSNQPVKVFKGLMGVASLFEFWPGVRYTPPRSDIVWY